MTTTQLEMRARGVVRSAAPEQRYSAVVNFIDKEVAKQSSPTSVDIYTVGDKWYCSVRCGDRRTRPMGPYNKRQAERMQDLRRRLIANTGAADLVFE